MQNHEKSVMLGLLSLCYVIKMSHPKEAFACGIFCSRFFSLCWCWLKMFFHPFIFFSSTPLKIVAPIWLQSLSNPHCPISLQNSDFPDEWKSNLYILICRLPLWFCVWIPFSSEMVGKIYWIFNNRFTQQFSMGVLDGMKWGSFFLEPSYCSIVQI